MQTNSLSDEMERWNDIERPICTNIWTKLSRVVSFFYFYEWKQENEQKILCVFNKREWTTCDICIGYVNFSVRM